MKGMVFSLDAMVAISFLFFAVLVLSTVSFQPQAPKAIYLRQLTFDTLTLLEKTDALAPALEGNSSGMRWIIDNTPEPFCIHVSVADKNGNDMTSVTKNACTTTGRDEQTASRDFIYAEDPYIVKARAWFRREIA